MTYAVQKTRQLADSARAERHAEERAVFSRLLAAFDHAIEADDSYTSDKDRRKEFQLAHLDAAAVMMGMEAGARRTVAVALVNQASIFRDLATSNGEDRREAGAILRLQVAAMRRSWGLA